MLSESYCVLFVCGAIACTSSSPQQDSRDSSLCTARPVDINISLSSCNLTLCVFSVVAVSMCLRMCVLVCVAVWYDLLIKTLEDVSVGARVCARVCGCVCVMCVMYMHCPCNTSLSPHHLYYLTCIISLVFWPRKWLVFDPIHLTSSLGFVWRIVRWRTARRLQQVLTSKTWWPRSETWTHVTACMCCKPFWTLQHSQQYRDCIIHTPTTKLSLSLSVSLSLCR